MNVTPSGNMSLPSSAAGEHHSLQEALDANGIDVKLPQWIPSEFSFSEIGFLQASDTSICIAVFNAAEKELQIEIAAYPGETVVTYEKVEGGTVYEANGQEYYILPNAVNLRNL